MIDVSIIIPVYFNEESISLTVDKIKELVISKNADLKFEIICIDDGSGDNSYAEIQRLYSLNRDLIRIIKFSRNFGQVQAMLAGYRYSSGKCVINVSADMQDPYELMNKMIEIFFSENIQIVIATRTDRDDTLFRKITSYFFYKSIKILSFPNMPVGGFDFALLGKKVVSILINEIDSNPFWQGQILWTGYPVKFLPYKREKRELGRSRWTIAKRIKYLVDGVSGYSFFPIRFMSVIGITVFLTGIFYSLFIVYAYFNNAVPFKGWAPIMIILLILFGLVMLMLGIIGEYLWRILDQVRCRPKYIIEDCSDEIE